MSTIKTPEQVAIEQTPDACTGYDSLDAAIERGDVRIEDVRALAVDFIEADRAQRIPRGAAQYIADELLDDLAPSEAVDMILALFGGEDPRVARIAELKAEWEEATGHSADDYMLSEDDWRFGLTQFDAAQIVRLIEEVGQ